jgi:hypothetical protein
MIDIMETKCWNNKVVWAVNKHKPMLAHMKIKKQSDECFVSEQRNKQVILCEGYFTENWNYNSVVIKTMG